MDNLKVNRYAAILEEVFRPITSGASSFDVLESGAAFEFTRDCIRDAASTLGLLLPKNVGDILYSFRYRSEFPALILKLAPPGMEWIIEGAGRGKYRARLVQVVRLTPNKELKAIKVPDTTPPHIRADAGTDEQSLLTRLRYSRLIGLFLGINTDSHQNHLRSTVKDIGQIEIDEVLFGELTNLALNT